MFVVLCKCFSFKIIIVLTFLQRILESQNLLLKGLSSLFGTHILWYVRERMLPIEKFRRHSVLPTEKFHRHNKLPIEKISGHCYVVQSPRFVDMWRIGFWSHQIGANVTALRPQISLCLHIW